MIKLNTIPLDYEPRNKVFSKLSEHISDIDKRTLMIDFDSAFLCGALKQFRPKKIVEVGIANGGTTAIILQALEDLGESYEMHSLDLYIKQGDKDTGFLAAFAKENNLLTPPQSTLSGEHKFHLGRFLPQVIDEIGGNIDLVILDTVHSMPGEGLDFLAVLPYLKIGSVVILHDVALHQSSQRWHNAFATGALFSAVTAEKFLNFLPDDGNRKYVYPNIAAFQINEQTAPNIENVFLTMVLRWAYLPSQGEIQLYLRHYQRHYPPELCKIFVEAVKMNLYNMVMASYV